MHRNHSSVLTLGILAPALLAAFARTLPASPLYGITGSYFVRAYNGFSDEYTAPGPTSFSADTSYTLPTVDYSVTGSSSTYQVTQTSEAQLFGSATNDEIHVFGEVLASSSRLTAWQDGVAYSSVTFTLTDTITPQSATLPQGTPVVFSFVTWTDGTFAPVGTCSSALEEGGSWGASGNTVNPIRVDGCATTSTDTTSSPRDVTLYIGVPFSMNWTFQLGLRDEAGGGIGVLEAGDTFEAIQTGGLDITPVTPGATFASASGALYQSSPAPEPASAALILSGVAILLARRKRTAKP